MVCNTDVVKNYTMTCLYYVSLYLCVCMSVANISPYIKTDLQNSHNVLQCPLPLLGTPVAALQYVMNFRFCG